MSHHEKTCSGKCKISVAMSGGVDSSVCALMLKRKGYDVIGITLKLEEAGRKNSEKTIKEAESSAKNLGIEHHVIDAGKQFREKVMDNFVSSYIAGETPSPCIRCNRFIKFDLLMDAAKELGAEGLATGHYVRKTSGENGEVKLLRGVDEIKDQSYFLFCLTREQLEFAMFPLGGMNKEEVKEHAIASDMAVAKIKESQDICFIPDGDYASFVKNQRPEAFLPGDIVHIDGRKLGKHKGIIHYTIGQRKGLGIGGGYTENNEPLFVICLDVKDNRVIVGSREDLACEKIRIYDTNWLTDKMPDDVMVKFRSVMKPVTAKVEKTGDNAAVITFEEKQYGVSSGQAAVIYDKDRVLGGGWIKTL